MKTRLKLDVRIDYNDDVDTGPTLAKYLKTYDDLDHRSTMHEDYLYERRLLAGSIGKNWDDLYSKFCERYDARTHVGFWMRRSILRQVFHGYPNHRWGHYYNVDENGNLAEHTYDYSTPRQPKPLEKIHWYGDVWFERVKCSDLTKCGCLHFKPKKCDKCSYRWRCYHDSPWVCIHGNKPLERYRWEVVTYAYHSPDEVYESYPVVDKAKTTDIVHPVYKQHIVYYRDKPDRIKYTKYRKTPNKKELQILKDLLAGVVEPKTHEIHANVRPVNRHKDSKPRKRLRADKTYPQDFSCENPRYVARDMPHTFRVR